MITVGTYEGGAPLKISTYVDGVAIYLDNFAVLEIAKGDPGRRARFVKSIQDGGAELLFSVANAAELVGPEGSSREAVKALLREFGPHWFPVELSGNEVCEREAKGLTAPETFAAKDLAKVFFSVQSEAYQKANRIIAPSGDFFSLDALIDWLASGKDRLVRDIQELDAKLIAKINEYRNEQKRDPSWLDRSFPVFPFRADKPAMFAYENLIRNLVADRGFQPKKGDGLDLTHAVLGSAFATIVALDKQWKRRVEDLPKPNGLGRVYYEPELGQMVADVESLCSTFKNARSRGPVSGRAVGMPGHMII